MNRKSTNSLICSVEIALTLVLRQKTFDRQTFEPEEVLRLTKPEMGDCGRKRQC